MRQTQLQLDDVRHVSIIEFNLLLVDKLDDIILDNYFGDGKWKYFSLWVEEVRNLSPCD